MLIKTDDLLSGKHGKAGHFVRFYDDSDTLLDEVASFLERALRARGRGVVIATGAYVDALRRRLDELARAEGRTAPPSRDIIWLDAETTLAAFMIDGWPDRTRFEYEVGRIVAEACAGGAPVHAFGEMVALLCARGRYDAALHLERLWNELARKLDFSLFCAYPWALFPAADVAHVFRQVCAEHTHACADAAACLPPGRPVDINLIRLEQKVHALQTEAARRRQAEKDLLRRERELADIAENAAEGLHQVGADGTILWANKAELQMLGYRWEEYVGHHIARFHADADVIAAMMARLAAGETVVDQPARLRCKDGSIRHVVIRSNACFEDGRLRYTRCFTRDVTDRWLAQEALRERAAILHLAMEAARMGYWTFAPVRASMRVSAELKAILDLPESESSLDAFAAVMQPDDARRFSAAVGRAVAQRERVECEFRTRSGKRFEARGEAIYDAAGSVVRVYGVCIARSRPAASGPGCTASWCWPSSRCSWPG